MEQIRWGIIGCGDVTEVKSGPAFNKVPNSRLVAVMRRDAAKAEDYARRHQVPKWYTDAQELIDDPEVNAIYIATPPLQHEEFTLKAIAAGKPVYVEKPMSLNASSAKIMEETAAEHDVKLVVAHYRRRQPLFLKVKELLETKTIGETRFIQLQMFRSVENDLIAKADQNWRMDPKISGGGLFHDLAPHQLDLMLYYFGKVKSANGFSLKQNHESRVDDLVTGKILFESGVVFNGMWCFTVGPQHQSDLCEIYGANGKISFPMFGNRISVFSSSGEKTYSFDALKHVQEPMIDTVVRYFRGETENPCSAAEAVSTMELLDNFTAKRD